MKNMIKDALILFAITLVAGLMLGLVNDVTKRPIAEAKDRAKQNAYKEVFVNADSFEKLDNLDPDVIICTFAEHGISGVSLDEIMIAKNSSDEILGYIITVTDHEGYGGDIQFSMGITLDGTLNGISLLSISETAGLGMQAGSVLVPQFANKKVESFTVTKTPSSEDSQIDCISGATITSKAIVNGVNAGLAYFQDILKGGSENE